jgi:ferredoxin
VIGYEKGSGGKRRPAFVTKPEDIERLVFDEMCDHNLSSYLSKSEYRAFHNIIIFGAVQEVRSILRLISENQLKGKNISVLVMDVNKEFEIITGVEAMIQYNKDRKITPGPDKEKLLAALDAMTREERFAFWKEQFSACIKCYACRAACPMCYCSRCSVEINQPQWISVPSTVLGNFEWHIMRAMHMAGRCIDCAACESACPLNIPIHMITHRMIKDIEESFGHDQCSAEYKNVLSTFQPDDKENFIQ